LSECSKFATVRLWLIRRKEGLLARYKAGLRTEARIIDATRELLGESGLEGTTLKAICDRAGVRAGSFYNLFPTKEDAVLRVVKDAIRAVDPNPGGNTPDSLHELVEAYISFVTGQPDVARVYLKIAISGATNGALASSVSRHHDRRVTRFAAAVEREHPQMDSAQAKAGAEIILATLSGLAFMWLTQPEFDFAGRARLAISASSHVAGLPD
jgi:AcrR family transcriptional regulator